jgi:hypothetical protein
MLRDFKKMTDEEILQLHQQQCEATLAQLTPQFEEWAGCRLEYSEECLERLSQYYMALLDGEVGFDKGDLPVPYWYDEERGRHNGIYIVNDLPEAALYSVMAFAWFFAEMLKRAIPSVRWEVFREEGFWDEAQIGMPVLEGIPNPIMVNNTVQQFITKGHQYILRRKYGKDTAFLPIYKGYIERAEAE